DGCIDGQLIYGTPAKLFLFTAPLNAWDGNPVSPYPTWPQDRRKQLSDPAATWKKDPSSPYRDEKMSWNFGDNKNFLTYVLGAKIRHTWTKPGVYSVT